ncbi:MAG: succinate dehydrogenase cytochrome b subunit [Bacteroides sp.]|nr:succinate dehydrogenase cytochrome b subunit [Bacteroidales bacterium]MBD5415143.1 succinate dehydrogenase cytochrome b subunit [Bacteroides sp.]MBD5425367.1 succinate dehydrogenase cytochrome b subunit [Bacteroides sp.]MDE6222889.1 succinate dehydrogenase cytochrome b subunit [Muribaculaceae bacterium]
MWLFNSSIGKKFIMAITGLCLVLFVTFHVLMNAVAICWPGAYNAVCQFLGANWYALIASAGLAFLALVHIIDAVVLTIQNRKARGNDRYAVNARPKSVEWSSQNMLVLGIVVVAFLCVHMVQFWARMQYQEVIGSSYAYNGVELPAAAGTIYLQLAFQEAWTLPVYLIGFIALWFHLNHGFWSMWQSIGWDNNIWLPRWKAISCWWVTIVVALFAIEACVFTYRANEKFYFTDGELVSQYQSMVAEHYDHQMNDLRAEFNEAVANARAAEASGDFQASAAAQLRIQEIQQRAMELQSAAEAHTQALADLANATAPEAAVEEAAPATEPANE